MSEYDGRVNVLLVDDKPEKLLALEAVLEDLQQNVVRAYSGREALRALLNQDFAVILLDVNMPGMDGFETASLIRQRKQTEHIPIIFVTAFDDENHSSRGYSLGAVDYIQTPVNAEVLRTKVAVFVDLYRKTEQIRRQAGWLQQRASQLHKLTAASLAINSALSMEKMLRIVTDTAREIIGANRASTTMVPDGNWAHGTTVVSASDKHAAWSAGSQRRDSSGLESLVCKLNRPVRLTQRELEEHPAWQVMPGRRRPPMRGWLAAPLTGRDGRNLGLIELTDRVDGDFTGDDEALLVQLAQMVSIAVENTFYAEERETNRIKDEFLCTLSHELRTPLNAIIGWTQLLQMRQHDDEVNQAVDVIGRNAKAQARLVEDLLDVSRVTSGKLRLNLRGLNLWPVISSAVDAIRPAAEVKQISVDAIRESEFDRLNGDGDRLQQVVWNLLSNAVKFTPIGGRVELRLDCLGENLRLRVTDSGQGINPAFLPHVFDRFRQADSTTTRSHGGLGIGLTIVRHIVELHGGTVHAESLGEGQGATFTVNLPVRADAEVRAVGPVQDGPTGVKPAHLGDLRVLVVDDEADARTVIGEILREFGAVVMTVASVSEAMNSVSTSKPDVILSDIAMPDQDGYDFVRLLRQLQGESAQIPAVALTAYARDEDRLRSLSAGFQAHLAKPVSPAELVDTILSLCPRTAGAVAS